LLSDLRFHHLKMNSIVFYHILFTSFI